MHLTSQGGRELRARFLKIRDRDKHTPRRGARAKEGE